MSSSHMEPFAVWGHNSHTKPKDHGTTNHIEEYVVYEVPRSMFRQAASMFSDVRHADGDSRYDEITLQLFLQMVFESSNLAVDEVPADVVYPYAKAWLEWVPKADNPNIAVSYRIHAISLSTEVRFGKQLSKMLSLSASMHKDSNARKMNTRKADPLAGLHPYQKWHRVNGLEMYLRTICDRYSGTQDYTSQMNKILCPTAKLHDSDPDTGNPVNPSLIFTIDRALARTPRSADPQFLDRAAYTGNPTAHATVKQLNFPSSNHVVLLTPAQLHPKVFCGKYLPEHQHWMTVQKAMPTKALATDYDNLCETEYDIRTPADIERARIEGLSDRSAFDNVAQQSKIKYAQDCLPLEGTEDFPAAYQHYQEWAIHAMKTQCLDPDAAISEVVSKMLLWRDSHQESAVIQHRITDASLSVFANRVVALMEGYEQYYLISTAHRMMFLIQHARYDAFRRDFGLHFNCFQAGEGATSKSFLFDQMAKQSIPGTVEVLTYQTGKADAVDGNRNDVTTVCHEAPPGMFRSAKNPNADSSQEAMFKEKLTSQRVTAKIWCQDEATGRRSARLTKSECVGVWMGATNDPPHEVEEALKTRFFWGNFEQQQRRGRDIDDCMNGERMMSTADKEHRHQLFMESKEEQFRVMLVEKAIWAGVIRDVNTSATNILLPRLKKKMTRNSIIHPGPRDWVRVKIFSRLMAIVTAIERVCNLPGGQHYGTPFRDEMIPDLEPHLCVTEEMVIFTLSLLSDQFRSPVEHKILNTIWKMEKNSPQFGHPTNEHSYDYLKLPRPRQLAKKINSRMSMEHGKTSVNNIMNFIGEMAKHSITVPKYKMPTVLPGSTASTSQFPVTESNSTTHAQQSCIIDGDVVYIHVSHVIGHSSDSSDSVFEILQSETHAHSASKRILTACPVSKQFFHVLKVIDRTPSGAVLNYHNVLSNTEVSRWITGTSGAAAATRTQGGYKIDKDIDEYCSNKLEQRIGKEVLTPQQVIERLIQAEVQEDYIRPDIRYPDTLVGAIQCSRAEKRSKKRGHSETTEVADNKRKRVM